MKIDLTPTKDKFYVQTNNDNLPFDSCNVTTMTAGLDVSKKGLDPILRITGYKQPEDKLRFYIENNPVVQSFYRSNFNTAIPAPEWAGVMVYAVNLLYEKKTVYYDDYLDLDDIKEDLQKGLPIYTSMRYPENRNASGKLAPVDGHIVLIVGINDDDSLIINDPFKNHLTGDKDGFHNIYTLDEFMAHNKRYAIRYTK